MRHHHPHMLRQQAEQLVFRSAELDGTALDADEMLGVVDDEVACGENRLTGRLFGRRGATAQKGAHPGEQLLHAKGFDDKIIAAEIEEVYAFILVAVVAEHNYWRLRELAQSLEQFHSAHIRESR